MLTECFQPALIGFSLQGMYFKWLFKFIVAGLVVYDLAFAQRKKAECPIESLALYKNTFAWLVTQMSFHDCLSQERLKSYTAFPAATTMVDSPAL